VRRLIEFILWGPNQRWRMPEAQRLAWLPFAKACAYAGVMKLIGLALVLYTLHYR